ncbi:MAG: branched-chain amino acid aminotransferase [Polaribacter sp.]|jgi:branched-chain amino acid aminotransferase
MTTNIKITKVNNSRLSSIDFNNIPFGRTFSDHMFVADYEDGEWKNMEIVPFGNFEVHPACMSLHYGQAIFEGMKATVDRKGNPLFLRPEMHSRRLNASGARLCMPPFPEDAFLEAIHKLVALDKGWIPEGDGSALYIRPFMFANSGFIGVAPSESYRFIIFTGPVGPYYSKPVTLVAEDHYVRAAKGGVGEAKAAGNYAASLLPAKKAKEKGYDQILWLDGAEFKYIQEVGTMNIFFVVDGKVITPITDGAILKGITRDSVMTILRSKGYEVEERLITIDEIVEYHKAGLLQECFGTGTAAVIAHVSEITYKGMKMVLPKIEDRKISHEAKAEIVGLRNGSIEDTRGWIVPVKELIEA